MFLRPLTDGKVSGTGTINVKDIGVKALKVLVSTNNSAAAVVLLRKNNATGEKIFDLSSITAGDYPFQPVLLENTDVVYYDITGTGAAAQIYGYVG
jgi:hypothetical protein